MFENRNPIENLLPDGGLTPIFRTIGVIGDSLASGEHESRKDGENGYHDYYEYSWGQYMARACGSTVYNFSAGGMTAGGFIRKQAVWDRINISNPDKKCQAYIIALGVNDLNWIRREEDPLPFGTIEDAKCENPDEVPNTFVGYMGAIMHLVKKAEPKARIFLITLPRGSESEQDELKEKHRELMYQLADIFEYTYVIDLRKHAPIYDEKFREKYYLGFHMNAMGYLFTAKMVMTYIDAIINEQPEDFVQIGFVGRDNDLHNENRKW